MNIDLINFIIKNYFIVIFTCFIILKLLNYQKYSIKNILLTIVFATIISIVFIVTKYYISAMFAFIALFAILSIFTEKITSNKTSLPMITVLISLSICFITFGIAMSLSYIFCNPVEMHDTLIEVMSIILFQGIIIYLLFKIKRYKKGLYFLQKNKNNEYVDIIMINISIVIILVYSLFGNYHGNAELIKPLFITLISLGIMMILIIQKTFVMHYKQKLLHDTVKQYETELKEKDNIIRKLSNEKYEISRINHEFYNRQKALELKVKEFTSETSNEIGILDRIENLTKEYSQNLQNIKGKEKLQLTSIPELDDMFSYMQSECNNNNIDFKLQIRGEIYYLVNNIIPTNKLETLIGDLLRNAIIAINSSDSKYKSILTILGIKGECYELCVCDSGMEFEIETLLKLGLERATTHKETGGSGIGFMTTFKTLEETKASLIIEEKHEMQENDYTKAIKIRFDGKNKYKIISYRADSIKEKCKEEKRIIIDKI